MNVTQNISSIFLTIRDLFLDDTELQIVYVFHCHNTHIVGVCVYVRKCVEIVRQWCRTSGQVVNCQY